MFQLCNKLPVSLSPLFLKINNGEFKHDSRPKLHMWKKMYLPFAFVNYDNRNSGITNKQA